MSITQKILDVLKKIELEEIKISMLPDQDIFMGKVHYKADNGWTIVVFSDCFCWDYIEHIFDEENNMIYDFDVESPISDYYCSDDVAEKVYKISDSI